jgi:hypothetical protein
MVYAVRRPEPIRKALDPSARVTAPTTDNQLLLLEALRPVEGAESIQVFDCRLVSAHPASPPVGTHPPSAVGTAPVPAANALFDF